MKHEGHNRFVYFLVFLLFLFLPLPSVEAQEQEEVSRKKLALENFLNSSKISFNDKEKATGLFNDLLEVIKKNKNLEPIYLNSSRSQMSWFFPSKKSSLPGFVWWLLGTSLLLLIIITFFIILLKSEVKVKTQDLWKKNRQLTLAKEKAEENERLKTIFLQNMSHEIRTPMNGIIGFLELLKQPGLENKEREKYIDIVVQSGKRLLTTINNIIEISKIDSDQITVHPSPVHIPEVMNFYYQFFQPQAREKKIDLKLNQQFGMDNGHILTDKFIFDNILTNLINNAIKFTKEGYVEFGNYRKKDVLIFYVKDTGMGIPPDRQKAIFQRFVQANLNITRPHEGSGLGLAIVKAYVTALKGEIWLESKANQGSTFYFSIPYIPVAADKTEFISPEIFDVSEKELTILVAEDDNISYLFIQQILKNREITVIRAKTGKECISLLKENPQIDLVLMDIKMPELNGIEAIKHIRSFDKLVPIIVQTAYISSGDKEQALAAGCNDYITKPVDRNRLLQLIRKYTSA